MTTLWYCHRCDQAKPYTCKHAHYENHLRREPKMVPANLPLFLVSFHFNSIFAVFADDKRTLELFGEFVPSRLSFGVPARYDL